MSAPQPDLFSLLSMSSAVDSPAKTYPTPARARVSKVPDLACGVSTCESFANFDPASSSWKTFQRCLLGGLEPFSGTWPKRGMMRAGAVFEQATLGHRTRESGSLLWPTPTLCGNHNRKGSSLTSGDGLATVVKMWPTPTCHDAKDTGAPSEAERNTPALRAAAGGALNPAWVAQLQGFPPDWCSLPDGPPAQVKPKKIGKVRARRKASKTGPQL